MQSTHEQNLCPPKALMHHFLQKLHKYNDNILIFHSKKYKNVEFQLKVIVNLNQNTSSKKTNSNNQSLWLILKVGSINS